MTFNVAIVGSGPAGFYVADALLQSGMGLHVDMIERLPVPFGLVRHGVAPDHQKLKAVTNVFESIAGSEGFAFLGNVELGRDVTVAELQDAYDAVVIATGAITDRPLGIDGEDLAGSVSATEFVGWYNGHPEFRDRSFDLSHPTAVIVGNGNVALDVCRILAKSVDELRRSDICEHALETLSTSRITDIHLVGRRGPAQAKFTTKELREFGGLAGVEPRMDPNALTLNPASAQEMENPDSASATRNLQILKSFADRPLDPDKSRRIYFRFLMSPNRVEGDRRVERVVFDQIELTGQPFDQRARPLGTQVSLPTGLLVRSVGYRGTPMPGLPFDTHRATIPHRDGRILDEGGAAIPGLYTAGWIKRGPSGVIGTNRACGTETSLAILSDLSLMDHAGTASRCEHRPRLLAKLRGRSVGPVDFAGWQRIDTQERAAGTIRGKPREKITNIQSMIEVALKLQSRHDAD